MKIFKITDPEFAPYGEIIEGYNILPFLSTLKSMTPLPPEITYVPEERALQSLPDAVKFGTAVFGGIPVQFGWCNGHNTKLNCLEYHRSSEIQLGTEDFILLLAKEEEIKNGELDTSKVKAFHVPAGVLIELYATALHYAPCHTDSDEGKAGAWIGLTGPNIDISDKL